MKIMIVDDHAAMRRMLRTVVSILSAKSLEIIECESGEEAVEQYLIQRPDCILMDLELKKMNGFDTTEEILKINPKANIIIVTANDTPSFRARAEKLHTQGYILKDRLFDLIEVLQTIT